MKEEKAEVDQVAYKHSQNFLGALLAFATAVILLVIQGSILPTNAYTYTGVVLLVCSLPFCFGGFILNVKLLRHDKVTQKSIDLVDKYLGFGIAFAVAGFGSLIAGASGFLGALFAGACVSAFGVTWYVARRFETLNPKEDAD